jgi:hypothetical protein
MIWSFVKSLLFIAPIVVGLSLLMTYFYPDHSMWIDGVIGFVIGCIISQIVIDSDKV